MSTGNLNDGLIAYANGRMVVLRVPYPMGFYAKGFDGRIDDPKARLEGTRAVGRQRRSHAVADRRRQGHEAARGALPAAARSAGQIKAKGKRQKAEARKTVDMGSSDMIGRTLSHYTLVSELGRGGMGVVYRALDVTLGREVALKVLPHEFVADPERRRRFIQEAKSAAALEHPHIGVVYEVGESDGITFIAMQLIRGEPLRDMLQRGGLPAGRAVELAREVAEGLSTAHDKGIVHRDLTPANIIVTDEGHAKIIDFGLAKLVERLSDATSEAETQRRTEAGVVMGTTSYMSPEQARGEEADHRSDVFTLGIVLYQMLSGETPFKRTSAVETMNAIITAPDPAVKLGSETDASSELRRIVHKCLAKNPRDRYQTMKDLVVDLREVARRLESGSHSTAAVVHTRPSSRRLWVAGVLAAVVLAGIAGYMLNRPQRPSIESTTGERKRIAILQFQNLGAAEDEYFAAGVTEEISSRLAGVSQLAVISRNSLRQYANTEKTSQQVGRELGVDFILQGTVRWQPAKNGPGRVRVTPQLIRVADDTQMWADTYERQLDEIFSVQSDIAARVSQQLGAVVLAPERKLIEATPTANLDAYKEYLRGNFLFFHRGRQQDRNGRVAVLPARGRTRPHVCEGTRGGRDRGGVEILLCEPCGGVGGTRRHGH